MKRCVYCGKEYPDDAGVCIIDGQELTSDGKPIVKQVVAKTSSHETGGTQTAHTVKPALMTQLRSLHLYLGCIFAPMLLFFAISGIWQTLGLRNLRILAALSTIHTSHGAKGGPTLTSPIMRCFVMLMAVAFITSTILGIIMVLKYGRNRRIAVYCLTFGVAFPLLLVLIQLL